MYRLNNNIYIAAGKQRACIYDLNNADLYSVSLGFASFLQEIHSYGKLPGTLTGTDAFKTLLQKKILLDAEESVSPIISISKPFIKFATFEITQKCNFRCIHCFENEKSYVDVPFEKAREVVDWLAAGDIKEIHLFGGEPFAHPRFCDILEYCKGKFQHIHVTTNAALLDDKILAVLLDSDVTVLTSLHSDLPESFDLVTGTKNMLPVVKNNISLMKDAGVNVQVRKVKIQGIRSTDHYENYHGERSGYPILIGNANIHQYSRSMLKKKVITEKWFNRKLDVKNVIQNMNYQACFSRNIYIDVNLDVYPCIMERRIKHGTFDGRPLRDLIDQRICGITKDRIDVCRDCEYRYACNTCFVDTRSSLINSRPWYCLYDPEQGTWQDFDHWADRILEE